MKVYIWCLHCERVYSKSEWLKNDNCCPNEQCIGSLLDEWPWGLFRLKVKQETGVMYPLVPVIGQVYPLYPQRRMLLI
jgi:hypothetical protein